MTLRTLLAWLAIVLGPMALLGSTADMRRHQVMARDGRPVTANVVSVQEVHGNRGADRLYFDLAYRTHHRGAETMSAKLTVDEGSVSSEQYEKLRGADTVPILYLPDDPSRVQLQGATSQAWIGVVVGIVLTLYGAVNLWKARQRNLKQAVAV